MPFIPATSGPQFAVYLKKRMARGFSAPKKHNAPKGTSRTVRQGYQHAPGQVNGNAVENPSNIPDLTPIWCYSRPDLSVIGKSSSNVQLLVGFIEDAVTVS
jgi:hypothetical protein